MVKYKEKVICVSALILFFSIYSKAVAFTQITLPESNALEMPKLLARTYILKLSGVRDKEKAQLWADETKRALASEQGQKLLAVTKCLTPIVRVVQMQGPNTGPKPWYGVDIAIGTTKREMAKAQKLLTSIHADNQQTWILMASKKDLDGLTLRCQHN
ncbi:hypothetical protein N480_15875 [Pseudoalteromonas luteoviolacea S2607]|uniref:hypothetical protein n=1 Tax=Pseudoalteromonas luteoviolacea TaxID=43657 RepID=UPI0007B08FF6|nr:hypothetical protein [Pseudoalteromonas luteoviolacea]KZN36748.1 hypothetical protein N480_15875 [Pseudoalteromonas luteoviolacea S2607]